MDQYLTVMILAAMPLVEIKIALPVALAVFKIEFWTSIALVLVGNLAAVPIIFICLQLFTEFFRVHFQWAKKITDWVFERTRGNFVQAHAKWGSLALIVFVALPFPGSGTWAGVLAAWLFGIKKFKAFTLITIGQFLAVTILLGLAGAYKLIF